LVFWVVPAPSLNHDRPPAFQLIFDFEVPGFLGVVAENAFTNCILWRVLAELRSFGDGMPQCEAVGTEADHTPVSIPLVNLLFQPGVGGALEFDLPALRAGKPGPINGRPPPARLIFLWVGPHSSP